MLQVFNMLIIKLRMKINFWYNEINCTLYLILLKFIRLYIIIIMNKIIFVIVLLIINANAATIIPTPWLHIPKIIEGFAIGLHYQQYVPAGKLCSQQTAVFDKQILNDLKAIMTKKYPDAENAFEDIFDKINDISQNCGDSALQTVSWQNHIRKNFDIQHYKEKVDQNYDMIVLTSAAALICYHQHDYFCYGKQVGTVFGLAFEKDYHI